MLTVYKSNSTSNLYAFDCIFCVVLLQWPSSNLSVFIYIFYYSVDSALARAL